MEADFARKGTSIYADKLGKPVAARFVSIVDDGTEPGARGSIHVDDEGNPAGRTVLVENGVLASYLHDAISARHYGVSPTGNGRREVSQFGTWYRFATAPGPQPTTLVLKAPDGGSDAELCEAAGDGIWVDQLGYAFPDSLSGAYGGEIRVAYRIRGGKRAEPVRGGTVGGLVFAPSGTPSLLNSLRAVGRVTELAGGLATGPALVADMTVAGE
jgi:TldD protein